jgi:hypothetical protein
MSEALLWQKQRNSNEVWQNSSCRIWGFRVSDYEEYPVMGYKNQVRTSQETHYVSAIEPSQLMLRIIWEFHGGDYEECRILRCLKCSVVIPLPRCRVWLSLYSSAGCIYVSRFWMNPRVLPTVLNVGPNRDSTASEDGTSDCECCTDGGLT